MIAFILLATAVGKFLDVPGFARVLGTYRAFPDALLVLEHPPVYTKGRRTEPADLPMGEDWYRAQGIEVEQSDRGGRVTYHGPGQLVAYPIMAISDVPRYVATIERAIGAALADEGIDAAAREDLTGVWAGEAKIGSIAAKTIGRTSSVTVRTSDAGPTRPRWSSCHDSPKIAAPRARAIAIRSIAGSANMTPAAKQPMAKSNDAGTRSTIARRRAGASSGAAGPGRVTVMQECSLARLPNAIEPWSLAADFAVPCPLARTT